MDMKKILQAMDGAKTKAEVDSLAMKKFLSVVAEADINQPAGLPAAPKFYITQTSYDSLDEPPDFSVTDLQRGIVVASFDSEQQARAYVAQKDPAGAAQTELHQMQSKATAPEANPDAVPQKPAGVAEEVGMSRFLSIVTESKGPLNRLTQAESIAVNHYNTAERKTITSPVLNVAKDSKPNMIGKYFKAIEVEFAESAERSKDKARQIAERVAERVVGGDVMESPYRRSSYYNPMDQERDQQRQMDYEKRDFKRREMEHELGHEDDPDFERKFKQQQIDRDRGPWYLKVNGKILKSKGEVKVFDWKKGANNYALAILKNKPELQGKIFLTKRNEDTE